jgi:hypothetical protein
MTETMAVVAIREAMEDLKSKGFQTYESYTVKNNDVFISVWVSSEGDAMTDGSSSRFFCYGLRDVERFVKMLTKLGETL